MFVGFGGSVLDNPADRDNARHPGSPIDRDDGAGRAVDRVLAERRNLR
ncbi:hypothetical protein [Saccharothrix yanglingensis]|nr:hypothetical protein [Saccharothrix yanglingensis]